jgi:light-regulated signal transduction histidine kinase (bacteriophytochrome)
MGVEIFFNGHKHFITADRLQILNLLLSTYEAAIQRNKELSLAEQNLRDTNLSLEAANKELDAFSHSVSHDLRAPIRAVLGFSNLLVKESDSRLTERERHLLRNICDSAEQMGLMIESLLDLSRLGRQPLSRRPVNMTGLVRQVLDEQRDQREGRQMEVRVGTLPDCIADPMLLKQVWVNLLSNASKYTRQKEKAVIEVDGQRQGDENAYFVRDNGAGFDMQYAAKLFGVFQRLHSSKEFEGTGVGLSIVQRIVQRHGGRIWAEAEVGKGATFYFSLPASAPARL